MIKEDMGSFSSMSFISAILIVLLHLGGGYMSKLVAVAVPWFFLASGFFLAKHIDEKGWYRQALTKRLKSIVVPFYIWLVVYKLCYLASSGMLFRQLSEWNLYVYLTGLHPFMPIQVVWYLRAVFFLVLVSPLLVCRGRVSLVLFAVFFGIADVMYSRCEIENADVANFFYYYVNIRGLFYFTIGMLLQKGKAFVNKSVAVDAVLVLMGVVMLWVKVPAVYSIPLFMYLMWRMCSLVHVPEFLARQSLPIYLMHMPVLIMVSVIVAKIGLQGLVVFWLKLLLGIMIPIIVGMAMTRWFPRLRFVLMGGR